VQLNFKAFKYSSSKWKPKLKLTEQDVAHDG
jgi:hypothetical protein